LFKRLIAGAAIIAASVALVAAAKPPAPPTLGVPQVVAQDVPWDGTFGTHQVRRDCPVGQIAFGPSAYVADPNQPRSAPPILNALENYQAQAVLDPATNRAVGYVFQGRSNLSGYTVRFEMSCAPVQ
jgi:hypothetical protein